MSGEAPSEINNNNINLSDNTPLNPSNTLSVEKALLQDQLRVVIDNLPQITDSVLLGQTNARKWELVAQIQQITLQQKLKQIKGYACIRCQNRPVKDELHSLCIECRRDLALEK